MEKIHLKDSERQRCEVWTPIPEYEDLYEISNTGRVRNIRTGLIKTNEIDKNGYVRIQLCKNKVHRKYFIHRLVATCFIENPQHKPQVNHKDMNRSNNNVDNLEWVTNSENQKHAIAHRGKLPHQFKNVPYLLTKADGTTSTFKSLYELTKAIGYSKQWGYNLIKTHEGYCSKLHIRITKLAK